MGNEQKQQNCIIGLKFGYRKRCVGIEISTAYFFLTSTHFMVLINRFIAFLPRD